MYADDSIISAYRMNVQEIELKITGDQPEISNWCDENRTVINVEKNEDHDRLDLAKEVTP